MPILPGQPKRSPMREILAAIKEELITQEVLGEDLITWAARSDVPKFTADKNIILRPKGFVSRRADQDGAGRIDGPLRRILAVHLRVRLAVDEADRDTEWLLKEGSGYFDLEDSVINILDMFWPHDSDGNALLCEPMRIIEANDAEKDREDNDWGDGTLYFEMLYYPPRDQSRQ